MSAQQLNAQTHNIVPSEGEVAGWVQSLGRRLREQLQVLEEDLSHTSKAARATGPTPGSLMALVLERSKKQPAALDMSSASLPPFQQIEGDTTPEGSGYEILLQVRSRISPLKEA
jgi:hypothetical protein